MQRGTTLVLALALCAIARAQGDVSIVAPVDRFVTPAERVELAFEVTSTAAIEFAAAVYSELGWVVAVAPDRVVLGAGEASTVSVTVDVPAEAEAFSVDRVTLSLFDDAGDAVERTVELAVSEITDVRLDAPTQANLGSATLRATVTNAGNSQRTLSIELVRDGDAVVDLRSASLPPGTSLTIAFDLDEEGAYVVVVRSARGVEVEHSVRAARFGTPEPPAFDLAGYVSAGFDIDDGWSIVAGIRGPLSHFGRVDALFAAPNWRSSYAGLTLERASVQVGAMPSAPFGLDLPREFGVVATYAHEAFGFGGMIGITANDDLAAYGVASWVGGGASLAAGGGVRAGEPVGSLVSSYRTPTWGVAFDARLRHERLDSRLTVDLRGEAGTTNLRVQLRDGFSVRARTDVEARYRTGATTLYGVVTAPIGPSAQWDWRLGLTHAMTIDVPGSLQGTLQVGARESFARATYRTSVGTSWQTTNTAGVRYDTTGFGLTLDSLWNRRGEPTFAFDTRLVYYPAVPRVTGVTRVRIGLFEDPVSLSVNGAWNIGNRTLGVDGALSIGEDDWHLDLDGGVRYAYARARDPWTFQASVGLTYHFDVRVSDDVTEVFGGRRLGTLVGTVTLDGAPLAGVVVSVGRFRAITGDDGRFELSLPPGTYQVALDRTTVPQGVTFADGPTTSTLVALRDVRELVFSGTSGE